MNMRIQRSSIVLAIFVVNIVSTITQYEATRIFLDHHHHHQEGRGRGVVWTRNVNMLLLLPSLQWQPISPPSPNPVTSSSGVARIISNRFKN